MQPVRRIRAAGLCPFTMQPVDIAKLNVDNPVGPEDRAHIAIDHPPVLLAGPFLCRMLGKITVEELVNDWRLPLRLLLALRVAAHVDEPNELGRPIARRLGVPARRRADVIPPTASVVPIAQDPGPGII